MLARGGVVNTEVRKPDCSAPALLSASYLSHYPTVGRVGSPTAVASNPVLEADDSSPWWQSRMVWKAGSRTALEPDVVPEHDRDEISSGLWHKNEPAAPVFDSIVYLDLGSGGVTALPIGSLVPVTSDWNWVLVEQVEVADIGFRPTPSATTEVTHLPAAEPSWNEAEDELPSWVELDGSECSGALMRRRRPSFSGE